MGAVVDPATGQSREVVKTDEDLEKEGNSNDQVAAAAKKQAKADKKNDQQS